MAKPRKRSDYRTDPRDVRYEGSLSFTQYLVGPYTRGEDWTPDVPPSGVMRIHHGMRDSGVPTMRKWFLRWLDGDDIPNAVPGVKFEEVQRSIERARADDPEAIAVLELRQGLFGRDRGASVRFCIEHGIHSDSTLTKRFYRAVERVVEYLCEMEWRRGREA